MNLRDRPETMGPQNGRDLEKTGGEEEERPFGGVFPDQDVAASNMRRLGKRKQLFPVRMPPARDDQQLSALFAPGCRPNERGDAIGCGLYHGPPGLCPGLSKSACYRRHSPRLLRYADTWNTTSRQP